MHVCICGEGRAERQAGGIVGGEERGDTPCNFHSQYSLVTVLYRCLISADDTQRDGIGYDTEQGEQRELYTGEGKTAVDK